MQDGHVKNRNPTLPPHPHPPPPQPHPPPTSPPSAASLGLGFQAAGLGFDVLAPNPRSPDPQPRTPAPEPRSPDSEARGPDAKALKAAQTHPSRTCGGGTRFWQGLGSKPRSPGPSVGLGFEVLALGAAKMSSGRGVGVKVNLPNIPTKRSMD